MSQRVQVCATCWAVLSNHSGVETLVEERRIVVDIHNVNGHVNRAINHLVIRQCLHLDTKAHMSMCYVANVMWAKFCIIITFCLFKTLRQRDCITLRM